MKTIAETIFSKVVKEGFYETLKPFGFKKKGNNFYLQLQGFGQIINIQKDRWNSKDRINFTINTGVFLPEYWLGWDYNKGKQLPSFPLEPECLIRKRIGELKNKYDTWYEIEEKTDADVLIQDMKINLVKYIIPFFQNFNNKNQILDYMENNELKFAPLGKLIVFGELKLFDKAKEEYRNILSKSNNMNFIEIVKIYGNKYGLTKKEYLLLNEE